MELLICALFGIIVIIGSFIFGAVRKNVNDRVFIGISTLGAILLLVCSALLYGYYTNPLKEHKDWPRYALEAAYGGGLLMFVGIWQASNGVFHFHRYKGGCTCTVCDKKRNKHHN